MEICKDENQNERIFHTIIREICEEKGIKVNKLSYNWILQLKKGEKTVHITGNRFDINKEAAGNIACDKYATYEILSSQDVPVIEHKMVFNPLNRSSYIDENGIWNTIIEYFEKNNKKVVVKPNYGCEGQGVYLCETFKDLEIAVHRLFKNNGSISLCPYYNIDTEYRTFYLNGECYLIYGKTKPFVLGDGVHTIMDLLTIENLYLPENSVVKENLSNLDLDYIPNAGEKYFISWKHNLSGGATPKIVRDEVLRSRIETLVKKASKAANIDFATVDVIKTDDDKMYVLEINSGVCMTKFIDQVEEGRSLAKTIYSNAIDIMLK